MKISIAFTLLGIPIILGIIGLGYVIKSDILDPMVDKDYVKDNDCQAHYNDYRGSNMTEQIQMCHDWNKMVEIQVPQFHNFTTAFAYVVIPAMTIVFYYGILRMHETDFEEITSSPHGTLPKGFSTKGESGP